MRFRITTIVVLFFCKTSFAQELDEKYQDVVKAFVECVKENNTEKLKTLITYPLRRPHPISDIKNETEFQKRYTEIFDYNLRSIIINSNLNKDWSTVGLRGIMLENGIIWLNFEGKLIGLNYPSKYAFNKQQRFNNTQYGFSMAKPNNWIEADKMELLNNLENFEFSEEELVKIINSGKGSILLAAFYKYNPDTHAGLIPTIQVNVRVNPTRNFNEFRGLITRSANGFEQYFNDFLFDVEPENIEVAGVESIYFVGKYTMQTQFGGVMKVRSRVYAIPYGSYFFQINFTDGQNKEDNSELFERLIQSVNVGR